MIVVIHETVSVTDPVIPFIDMLKRVQKANAIMVVFKDSFLLIAARGDMIDCAGVFNAKGTGHAETLAEKMGNVKIKDLTLLRCDRRASGLLIIYYSKKRPWRNNRI
jgi:hypothetical protein